MTFGAPAFSFRKHIFPHGRLWPLLQEPEAAAAHFNFGTGYPRLASFMRARNAYLRGLAQEDEQHAIDAYLESARLSEDFTAGYAQCLSTASLWLRQRPEEAKQLLERLIEAQPSRTVAREMLGRIK